MSKLGSLFFIGLCICCWDQSNAQIIKVIDSDKGNAIEGVFVQLLSDNDKRFAISSAEGEIELSGIKLPVIAIMSHLNYHSKVDTIRDLSPIYLLPSSIELNELVITGQYFAQSAENSLYKVRTIRAERIEQLASTSLDQILKQELNIQVTHDGALGSSSMSIMGIDGQNVKFLLDGVPIAGRTGNSSDLGQINLDNIEQIEIVEGPMAVNYGTNSLAGVVNIITKSPQQNHLGVNGYLHEESVGKNYGLVQGIHQQGISTQIGIGKGFSTWMDLQRYYFGGFQGEAPDRSFEWLPKVQWKGSGKVLFQKPGLSASYKIDVLDELIESPTEPASLFNPIALDEEYSTNRFTNIISIRKSIHQGNIDLIVSRSDYERTKTQYAHNLSTGEMPLSLALGAQDTAVFRNWNLRGSFKNLLSQRVAIELGTDIVLDKASGGRIINGEEKIQNDYALYGSSELYFGRITLKPAARLSYNTSYDFQVTPSFNLKYELSDLSKLKFAYGRGFRSPSLRELYFEFIDSDHNVLGNKDLNPETADHLSAHLEFDKTFQKTSLITALSIFYNNIRDQIEFGQSPNDPQATTYINISKFQSVGFTLSERLTLGDLSLNIGISYVGRKSSLNSELEGSFLFNPEVNSNADFRIPKIKVNATLSYKYTGRLQQYYYDTDTDGNSIISKGYTDDFHWMDLSLSREFGKYLLVNLGARNLLNQKRLSSTLPGGSVHGAGAKNIGYGTSFYLRINFKLNKSIDNRHENN